MMYWIHPDHPDASQSFSYCLSSMLRRYNRKKRPLIFVCIGTPSILGDCLGPVIGSILSEAFPADTKYPTEIYGTLDAPVHALNFQNTCREIKKRHQEPFIIAIDAALGNASQSGFILLKKGPLCPGKGVGKKLPPIGHLQIAGVFQDIFAPAAGLEMARFSRCISQGILKLHPALQCPQQSNLINVLKVPADGNTAGNPAHLNPGRLD